MIYGFLDTTRDDFSVLINRFWAKPEDRKELTTDRVQVAAFRMIATVVMALGGLWALSMTIYVVTSLAVFAKLGVAVTLLVLGRDAFKVAQNYNDPDFCKDTENKPGFFAAFFRSVPLLSEEGKAKKISQGTLVPHLWMWAYKNKSAIPLPKA